MPTPTIDRLSEVARLAEGTAREVLSDDFAACSAAPEAGRA